MKHFYSVLCGLLLLGFFTLESSFAQRAEVIENARFNQSQPIRDIPPQINLQGPRAPFAIANKNLKFDSRKNVGFDAEMSADPLRQMAPGPLAPTIFQSFDGSSDDDNAAVVGTRIVPPDTDGDVGPNHYLQWINLVSEIFDKNGNTLMGPFPGNQYFAGLGGICETTNDGDPIVLYDEQADRWLVSQFAVPGPNYSMCVAISQTPDPMGAYNQYEFSFGTDFADYPKLGIWGDSYIMTTRDFANGQTFAGISAVAMDRTAMLNGQSTSMVRFPDAFNVFDGAIPADFDGAGASGPAVFGAHGADGDTEFELWELDIDWANPGAATFNSIPGVTISAYDGNVPSANQPNGQVLDDLSGFTMFRLNARDFGTHVSMVANHTVEASAGTAGVRWYEFRNTGGNWTLHQEGTFSPDSDDRWMGSIAINAAGDIALGYSRSSSTLNPSIYFTGQTASASGTGVMNIAETAITVGGGSQEGASRWGDYSMMSVDPTNDTFWYTTEYYAATGSFDFNTRIANFELGVVTPAVDVAVSNLTTGTSPAPQGKDFATATVTVVNDQGFPVSGYTVTGDFSGTIVESGASAVTNSSGVANFTSAGSSRSKNFTVEFCVSDVTGALPYDENDNASSSYACDGGGPGGNPTEVVVASISTGSQGVGGGDKIGTATVTLQDDLGGNPGAGYTVVGDFSGDINESSVSAVTNSSGVAQLETVGTARGKVTISFCVSDVSGGTLPYNGGNTCTGSAPSSGADQSVAAAKILDLPETFSLDQNYPNPFNPTTIMSYSLPESGHVSIRVYNLLGQEMATVVDGFQDAGSYEVAFDASHLSAGVYLYVMQSGEFSETRRMTLLK